MPGVKKQELTSAQQRRLKAASDRVDRAEDQLQTARADWAELVREIGISATARFLDLTPQAVAERIKTIESRARRK
jgi:hypothetical protein